MSQDLRNLSECFLAGLSKIREVCLRQDLAADLCKNPDNGMPTEEAVCAALIGCRACVKSLCQSEQAYWHCAKTKAEPCKLTALAAITCPEIPISGRYKEYLFDFVFASHKLPVKPSEIFGPETGFHRFLLAVESELNEKTSGTLAERDLIKLCVVKSPIRMLIYIHNPGRMSGFEEILRKWCNGDPTEGGNVKWLFVGLEKQWMTSPVKKALTYFVDSDNGRLSLTAL